VCQQLSYSPVPSPAYSNLEKSLKGSRSQSAEEVKETRTQALLVTGELSAGMKRKETFLHEDE
jgi:hypothetical protein